MKMCDCTIFIVCRHVGLGKHLQHLYEWPHPLWRNGCSGSAWWQTHPGPKHKGQRGVHFFFGHSISYARTFLTDVPLKKSYCDLLLLGAEGFLKVLVLLQQSLHAVQGISQILVQQEGLQRRNRFTMV